MRRIDVGLVLSVLIVLSSCVAVPVRSSEAQQAYVGGLFSTSLGTAFVLVLLDDRGRRHELEFGDRDLALEGHLELLALPAGKYRLVTWKSLNYGWNEPEELETDVPRDHPLAKPFTLEPGEVTFLAKFNARKGMEYSLKAERNVDKWEIFPVALPLDQVEETIRSARPELATAKVTCLMCRPRSPEVL